MTQEGGRAWGAPRQLANLTPKEPAMNEYFYGYESTAILREGLEGLAQVYLDVENAQRAEKNEAPITAIEESVRFPNFSVYRDEILEVAETLSAHAEAFTEMIVEHACCDATMSELRKRLSTRAELAAGAVPAKLTELMAHLTAANAAGDQITNVLVSMLKEMPESQKYLFIEEAGKNESVTSSCVELLQFGRKTLSEAKTLLNSRLNEVEDPYYEPLHKIASYMDSNGQGLRNGGIGERAADIIIPAFRSGKLLQQDITASGILEVSQSQGAIQGV